MGDVGEVFSFGYVLLVGGALGRGEGRYWPSSGTSVGDIDTWGCEGFAGSSVIWALQSRHGFLPLFLRSIHPRPLITRTRSRSIIKFPFS